MNRYAKLKLPCRTALCAGLLLVATSAHASAPVSLRIASRNDGAIGQTREIAILCDTPTPALAGFDLSIGFDAESFSLSAVTAGRALQSAGWQIFTYRLSYAPACGLDCPSTEVKIIARAIGRAGAPPPVAYQFSTGDTLAILSLRTPRDCDFSCLAVPVSWYWRSCQDNRLLPLVSDSVWVSSSVYDPFGLEITDPNPPLPNLTGAPESCIADQKASRLVDFRSGAVDIPCTDSSTCCTGDLNLNGHPYDIGDVILYDRFFVFGFPILPWPPDAVTAESDANCDGTPLSVADMVFILREIAGDMGW